MPIESAIATLYSNTRHFERTIVDPKNGDTYVFTRDFTVGVNSNIENVPVRTIDIAGAVTRNGVPAGKSAQTDYFQLNNYRLIAQKFAGSPLYVVASNQQPLPATGKPGDSGKFYDAITYESTGKGVVLATSSQTWNITPDTDTSVTFCIVSTSVLQPFSTVSTKSDCYKIDTTGFVTSVSFSLPN